MAATPSQLDGGIVRGMAIGAVFTDYAGKISCLEFQRKEDLLVTEDDSIRLYNTTSATEEYNNIRRLAICDAKAAVVRLMRTRLRARRESSGSVELTRSSCRAC